MSWPEKALLVLVGIAAAVAVTVWLLRALASHGRHNEPF